MTQSEKAIKNTYLFVICCQTCTIFTAIITMTPAPIMTNVMF